MLYRSKGRSVQGHESTILVTEVINQQWTDPKSTYLKSIQHLFPDYRIGRIKIEGDMPVRIFYLGFLE
jgi:hypothetical protein